MEVRIDCLIAEVMALILVAPGCGLQSLCSRGFRASEVSLLKVAGFGQPVIRLRNRFNQS
jgi:hypothetical protein